MLLEGILCRIDYDSMYTWLFIAMIGVMLLGLLIQSALKSVFKKYSRVNTMHGMVASDVVREILYRTGCGDTNVQHIAGNLTDNFNPRTKTVSLSDSVYNSSSVAALSVAVHELGHVMQHKEGYVPIKIRNAILPVANIGSIFAPYIVIFGVLFEMLDIAMVGVWLYAAVLVFQLITLPVEFNASSRAISLLTEGGYIQHSETPGAKKVLRMAAMTYVVATLATLISVLRLLLIVSGGRSRD